MVENKKWNAKWTRLFSRFIQPRFEHLPRIGLKAYDTIHGIDIQITSNKVLKRTGKLLFALQGTEH